MAPKKIDALISKAIEQARRGPSAKERLIQGYKRAEGLVRNKHFDEAIELYTKMIEILPISVFYNQRGNAFVKKARYTDAISDFTQAIEYDASDADYFANRGSTFLRIKDIESAIADLDHAIAIQPNSPIALNSRALAREEQGNIAGAVSDFLEAIKLNPDYFSAKHNLAGLYFRENRLDEALKTINQIVPMDDERTLRLKQQITEAIEAKA